MEIDRKDFEQRFEQLSNQEIIRQLQSGNLTEVARGVATVELHSRGVSVAGSIEAMSTEDQVTQVDAGDLVELARMLNPTEAQILQARLIADGVPAVVTDVNLVQANYFLSLAVGGVRILVPESFLAAAQEIKAAVERGDYSLEEGSGEE